MPLATTCEQCGTTIFPVGHGRTPRYCSASCRAKAHRAHEAAEEKPRATPPPPPVFEPIVLPRAADADDGSRLAFLIRNRDRIDVQLSLCPPDRAAALHKEFRETLREIDQLQAEQKFEEERVNRSAERKHRSFDATAFTGG